MDTVVKNAHRLKDRYWPLLKSRQTFLLTLTGVAGYFSQPVTSFNWLRFAGLLGSMLLSIGGCTILNMYLDRDIDSKMERTRSRPLPAGLLDGRRALVLALVMILLGLAWSFWLSFVYFVFALAGAGLNILVYTVWLKRRTAWSILWGGFSGAVPILAGRTLALGRVDIIGLLLALAILCWIPSHNLTLGMLYPEDFRNAGVPAFINVYGQRATRLGAALSSVLTFFLMIWVFALLKVSMVILGLLLISGLVLVGMAVSAMSSSERQGISRLFKLSSFYMLAAMLLLVLEEFL